jgi:hypothetical protein
MRWLLVVLLLGAGIVVLVLATRSDSTRMLPPPGRECVEESADRGIRLFPCSGPLELDTEYRFSAGHCGIDVVDLDGSLWRIEEWNGVGDQPSFYFEEDEGVILLTERDRAIYTSFQSGSAAPERLEGPAVVGACA